MVKKDKFKKSNVFLSTMALLDYARTRWGEIPFIAEYHLGRIEINPLELQGLIRKLGLRRSFGLSRTYRPPVHDYWNHCVELSISPRASLLSRLEAVTFSRASLYDYALAGINMKAFREDEGKPSLVEQVAEALKPYSLSKKQSHVSFLG